MGPDPAYAFQAGVGIGTRETGHVPRPAAPCAPFLRPGRGGTQSRGAPIAPFFNFCFKTRFFARKLVLELLFWYNISEIIPENLRKIISF
jgi:hypothetical protein